MPLRCEPAETDFAGSCFICGPSDAPPDPQRRRFLAAATALPFAAAAAPAKAAALPTVPSGTFGIDAGWALIEKNGAPVLQRDAFIVVRDGAIEEVRAAAPRGNLPRVDARNLLVLPGFISGHTHVCCGTPTRGLIEAGRSYRRPLDMMHQLPDDELDALTAINLAELLRSGCTTQVEMSLTLREAESYVRVAKVWGVRGYPGPMIPDGTRNTPIWYRADDKVLFAADEGTLADIANGLKFAKAHMNANGGLIRPMMCAHATDTHTEKTMTALAAAVRELGTGLHIHLSQGGAETSRVKALWGMTPAHWLKKFGFYDFPVFGAHMTGVEWEGDAPVLRDGGVIYAHCPAGGGAGAGSQPYPEALAAGVKVCIGIDTHSNDFVEDIKQSVIVGRLRARLLKGKTPTPMQEPTIWDSINGATRIPADGLRRKDLGRIVAGARADLTMIDVSGPLVGSGALPPEPLNNLLYANGLMVRHVMTDGRLQIFDGHLMVADEQKVAEAGGRVVAKMWKKLADEGFFERT